MSAELPELFAHALELDDAGRKALLRDLSRRDPARAAELAEILAGAEDSISPLDRALWRPGADDEVSEPHLPERIGDYRIVRQLGRGGMGRVFLAVEEAEAFHRTVALKVIDRPAFDEEALRRFRDEVRILSSLEHPGIARFLNGGKSPDGVWFLALEYIDGKDLLAWAQDRNLSVRRRIELFLAALEAVSFAHARGVVHRDLKPGHILVDPEGRPRLLDFGISKLIDPETQASLAETRTEARALTPAYASPEQFRGEPVTAASDVYSLGAILYELLAGRRPFAAVKGSALALERAVLETDPEPPSTAARKTAEVNTPGGGLVPRALPRGESWRDLDAICLRSLRKSPAERYGDAGALADDLRRFLDGRPVEARRGGVRYRAGRFLRRHRAAIAIAGALAITAGAAFVAWRAERRVAELRPVEPKPQPFPYLAAGSPPIDELERRFDSEPANVDAGAAFALALVRARRVDEAKLIVSRLRQIPGEAANPLIDYVDGMLALAREEPQLALVRLDQARARAIAQGRGDLVPQVRASRGRLLATLGRRDEAKEEMHLAVSAFEEAGDHGALAGVLNDLAIEYLQQGQLDEGKALLRRGMEASQLAGTTMPSLLLNLGILETFLGRPDLAEEPLSNLVAAQRRSNDRAPLGQALCVLAHVLFDLGRSDEAERAYGEGLGLLREGADPLVLRSALEARSLMDVERGRWDRVAETLVELESRAPGAGEYNPAGWLARLRALAAAARGDSDRMRREFAVARTLLLENGDVDQAAEVDSAEALAEWRADEPEAAARLARQALAQVPESYAAGESAVIALTVRARTAAAAGRLDEARNSLAGLGDATSTSPSVARRMQFLAARAELAKAEGRFDDARRDLAEGVAVARSSQRKVDELYLRFDQAALERAAGDAAKSRALALAVSAEAAALELGGVVSRVARLAAGEIGTGSVRPSGL